MGVLDAGVASKVLGESAVDLDELEGGRADPFKIEWCHGRLERVETPARSELSVFQ